MSDVVIKVENLSKQYRLGNVSMGTLSHDLNRWWYSVRGKDDPYLKIGEENDRSTKGLSDYVWAIRDINFDVKHGEVLGIIGRNGAGKSTLLKILSRTTTPTTGSVKIKGRVASLLEVGTGFHPELSGRENIFLNGAILGMTRQEIKGKFDEIVDFAGVERYIDTPVKRYSSGMYVRLAFGVAAHLEPEILIVDEVLAVGDAEFQKKALGKMKEVSTKEGRTVLFVSHNMGAVKMLCVNGIILRNGSLTYSGNSVEAVSEYLRIEDNNTVEKLSQRKDRVGNQQITFTDISITNLKGEEVSEIFAGEKVIIKLKYKVNQSINFSKFLLSIVLFDSQQQIMAGFPSDEMGHTFKFEDSEGIIALSIESLLLRPNKYYISIYSFLGTTNTTSYVDTIQNVASINVLKNDFFKKGVLIREGNYTLLKGTYY